MPGHRLVVADAAQLEPRVLAAISKDAALQAVSADEDLYTALADDGFGGDRAHAKLAMLGAMYGQTSGEAGRLLDTLRRSLPGRHGSASRTRRVGANGARSCTRCSAGRARRRATAWREAVEWGSRQDATDPERKRADLFARDRGRFTRNFVVQGSAADWAAVWLSGLRRDLTQVPGAELVFFQHDELIVHVPLESASLVADLSTTSRCPNRARTNCPC